MKIKLTEAIKLIETKTGKKVLLEEQTRGVLEIDWYINKVSKDCKIGSTTLSHAFKYLESTYGPSRKRNIHKDFFNLEPSIKLIAVATNSITKETKEYSF